MTDSWQPIETAPKNGRLLLLWTADRCMTMGMQIEELHGGHWIEVNTQRYVRLPTHWMDLPKPPKAQ